MASLEEQKMTQNTLIHEPKLTMDPLRCLRASQRMGQMPHMSMSPMMTPPPLPELADRASKQVSGSMFLPGGPEGLACSLGSSSLSPAGLKPGSSHLPRLGQRLASLC